MNQLTNGFIGKVFRLRIHGNIDQKLSDAITRGLSKSWPYRPTALLVTINSPGGSVVQAKSISDLLRLYSNRYNVPIVTFAEDQCLGSANLLLTTGVKCYANSFSLLGDVGFVWSRLWYTRFGEKYNIKKEYVAAGENKVKFNQFEQLKPESQKWAKNYIFQLEHELKQAVTNNRSEQFTKKNLSKQTIQKQIFNAGAIDPETAVKLGYIDGIRNIDQQLADRYANTGIVDINKPCKSWKQKLNLAI